MVRQLQCSQSRELLLVISVLSHRSFQVSTVDNILLRLLSTDHTLKSTTFQQSTRNQILLKNESIRCRKGSQPPTQNSRAQKEQIKSLIRRKAPKVIDNNHIYSTSQIITREMFFPISVFLCLRERNFHHLINYSYFSKLSSFNEIKKSKELSHCQL